MTIITTKEGATAYATLKGNVLCSVVNADLTNLVPCSHEEADPRLCSYMWLIVLRQDTRKRVLDIAHYNNIKPNELWMAFGTGFHFRYKPVHELTASLDTLDRISCIYRVRHFFAIRGGGGGVKKTTWVTCQSYPEATGSFEDLLLLQDGIRDQTMSTLGRFVVLLYDRTSDFTKVNNRGKHIVHTEVLNN